MGENTMGAGNQQGRPEEKLGYYIAGFVDGEGSFHVAVQRNPTVRLGWQVVPEFHVSQHAVNKAVLELIKGTLRCGYIKPNHSKKPSDETWVFVVKSHGDLLTKVIPFFHRYRLHTTKQMDFEKFATIVQMMDNGRHKDHEGFRDILKIAFSMNASGTHRRTDLAKILSSLEPSETVRRTPLVAKGEDTVRAARRRAEAGRKACPPRCGRGQ
jgi:hypothetical protein